MMDIVRLPAARIHFGALIILLFPGQSLKIGRAAENEVVIQDAGVSRVHAGLEWNGSGFTLTDLNSANGTYVNGQRLAASARLLRDGDQIGLGMQTLLYAIARVEPSDLPNGAAHFEPGLLPTARGARLVVSAGPDQGQEYPLWGEVITIGRNCRDATWEIRLSDREVSRPHARLEKKAGRFSLVDLESVNGTMLNDLAFTGSVVLNEGDVIAVGSTRLIFSLP